MRVLVCGSRTWDDWNAMWSALVGVREHGVNGDLYDRLVVIHGAARGADTQAGKMAAGHLGPGVDVVTFPADWDRYGKRAGYVRNQQMLDEGKPDLVLAFVDKPLAESKGTAMMVDLARKAGVRTYVIEAAGASTSELSGQADSKPAGVRGNR